MEARTRKSVILCILTIAVPLFSGLGLALIFALCHFRDNEVYLSFTGVAATICLFASLSIVAVELVAHLFNKQASWNTLLAAFGLFIMFVIAPDATNLYRFDPSTAPENMGLVFETASHLGGIIAMIGLFRFLKNDYHIHFEKREVALSYTLPILGAAVFFPLALLQLEYVVTFIDFFIIAYWTIKSYFYLHKANLIDTTFIFSAFILNITGSISLVVTFGHCFPSYSVGIGLPSLLGFAIIALFYAIYLTFVIATTHNAYKKEEFEKQAIQLQSTVLKEQIKPHFLFNVLNAIKFAYRNDPEKGEKAIDLFSKYLRSSTEAASVYLVPLQKELELISWYVDLENIKVTKPYQVIFNIDAYDFEVPYFGLQPLIENAIKYAKLQQNDGYIEITTLENPTSHTVIIHDNGAGFDTNAISTKSYGIGNTKGRFQLLLNADFKIQSKPGEGTTITIIIPKGESPYESDRRR